MLTLLDDPISGNGYKIRLLLAFLDTPYEYRTVSVLKSETRTPEFLAISRNGKIPVLILEDGTVLPESNAILHYLAAGSSWLPSDRLHHAQVLHWMFWEQYSHEPNIATLRFWNHMPELDAAQKAMIPGKHANGLAALKLMNDHLERHDWFVAGAPTIADIALFAYTHVAEEGDFKLADYPNVESWIARMQGLPGFVPMETEA
ncbi:MAG: glutathione S-transferase family protein [Rhodospirillales bacterium]|nr:glutathione S-transferase family protein [Rhodospirillales bacterium]MBO6788009.1 glutathione S-transferase family protein [Rhodospirillales bacterium]